MQDLHEACAVFGIYAPGEDVSRVSFFALYAMQHRGQESSGIATVDHDRDIRHHAAMGLVAQVFDEDDLSRLRGNLAIGHNRYSTTGSSRAANAQPIIVETPLGPLGLAHNGNVVNADPLRNELIDRGIVFRSTTDSEVIAQLIALSPGETFLQKIRRAMMRLEGAYSLTLLTQDAVYAVRDPLGVRPLCLGQIGSGWVAASETCALDHIGASFIRDVEPGEIVQIDHNGITGHLGRLSERQATCVFEFIYFARPDSVMDARLLYLAREEMGAELSKEHPIDADLVMAIPDSATAAGIGYAREAGIPFREGLLKNRYVGRTFIQPDQRIRDAGVRLKFNPLPHVLEGKKVIVVDDSIVRGTTTPHVVQLLRRAGAREVHLRVCAPPITHPCFFGVDLATKDQLIAAHMSVEQIREYVGADSLGYLSLDGLHRAVGLPKEKFCTACFTGKYPIPVGEEMDKLALEGSKAVNARFMEIGRPPATVR